MSPSWRYFSFACIPIAMFHYVLHFFLSSFCVCVCIYIYIYITTYHAFLSLLFYFCVLQADPKPIFIYHPTTEEVSTTMGTPIEGFFDGVYVVAKADDVKIISTHLDGVESLSLHMQMRCNVFLRWSPMWCLPQRLQC